MNSEYIYKRAEVKANKFNIYCLIIIAILGIITIILNEIEIFTVDKVVVRTAMSQLAVYAIVPTIIYLINDKLLKKPTVLEYHYFKAVIIICAFASATVICIPLSYHAVLFLAVPTLMTAQYRNSKRMMIFGIIASLLLVVVSVFGSFLFGVYDANLLKPLDKYQAEDIANRIEVLTPKRALEIFFHYALPEIIAILVIDFIGLSIIRRTAEMVDTQVSLSDQVQEEVLAKAHMQNGVIEHLADIIESRDLETGEHIKRTKSYVQILVNKMKDMDQYKDILSPKMCENIVNAAPLHDIGKIAVSDLILCKPGRLTEEEFNQIKIHTIKGGEIINSILNELGDKEFLEVAYEVATAHHEKWDGTGYPYGLKGEDIPLPGRIMAIADVFDALVAERVYKKPMPIDDAINIIIKDAGTHFDPYIVEIFQEVLPEFKSAATKKL